MAASFFFLLNGVLLGNWITRIPAIRQHLDLTAGELGMALLGLPLGSLIMMPLVSRLLIRAGSAHLTRAASAGYCVALTLPALAPNLAALAACLLAMGLCTGVLNVAANAQAVAVEYARGRPLMASFHAFFSIGGMLGSAAGGLIAASQVAPRVHLAAVAGLMALASLAIGPWLIADPPAPAPPDTTAATPVPKNTGVVIRLCLIAFCIMCAEQAAADWSSLYLVTATGAGPAAGGAAYAVFAGTMAAGRLIGDRLTLRFGPVRLVRGGAVLAASGLSLALLVPDPAAALAGFACLGAGFSCIIPTALGTATRMRGDKPGLVLAAVMAVGYVGMLTGPPLIGALADVFSLRLALALLVFYSATAVLAAGAVDYRPGT